MYNSIPMVVINERELNRMTMEEEEEDNQGKKLLVVFLRMIANIIAHILIGVVIFEVIKLGVVYSKRPPPYKPVDGFQLHIVFSVLGYQLMMAEAIMSFSKEGPGGGSDGRLPRVRRRPLHLCLALTGGILTITGATLALVAHGAKFDSIHGICGLIALIFSIVCILNGILTYFSLQLRDRVKPATIKAVHTVCGMCAFTMGLVTLCLGLNKPMTVRLMGKETTTSLTVLVVLILVYVLATPMASMKTYFINMRSTVL